jgi:CHAT domain-containing protein
LLAPDPPAQSPTEVSARRKVIQGEAFCRLSRPPEAELVFGEAGQLIPPARRDLQAELALARGRCSLSANHTLAKQYFTTAAELAHGGDRVVEASALANIGFLLLQDERYDEAIDRFTEVLALTDSPYNREKALGNLGFSSSQLGDWKGAISFSQQAESLAAEIKNTEDQEKWFIDLGRERFSQLEYTEAEISYAKALSIARERQDTGGQANVLHHLTQLALKTHDLAKAETHAREEEALQPQGTRYLELLLDRAEIARAREDFPTAQRFLEEILHRPGVKPVFRWRAQSDLAAVYVAQKRFEQAEQAFREAIGIIEEMRRKIPEEHRISFLDEAPFYDQYVRFLVAQKRPLEAISFAERGRSPTLAEALGIGADTQHAKFTLAHIQNTLRRRRKVVLAYWLAEQESYLWVITPAQVRLFYLPPEMRIRKLVEQYNQEILERGKIEESVAGRELYETLVRPAEKFITRGANVVVVPHRKLYEFNFETLIVPGPVPHYWIEDVGVENASFLALLTNPKQDQLGRIKDLLLLGAPVEATKEFPVLNHAAEEMERVANHFPAVREKVIAGSAATPEAYLSTTPGEFRFLHFVTHGTASLERPFDSAIILSPGPQNSYKLYARGIKDVRLHANLVTISACYGAGKRQYSGEGLVGLAWAFMRAGAHQVVAALWEVDDASSPQLMDDFYSELSKGKSAAEALRAAKLKMLHSNDFHRRPYYWASLQLYTGS